MRWEVGWAEGRRAIMKEPDSEINLVVDRKVSVPDYITTEQRNENQIPWVHHDFFNEYKSITLTCIKKFTLQV
jgi:hypothetical protein